jgi:hypothetical protein
MKMELWSGKSFVAARIIRFGGFSYQILIVFSFSELLGFLISLFFVNSLYTQNVF